MIYTNVKKILDKNLIPNKAQYKGFIFETYNGLYMYHLDCKELRTSWDDAMHDAELLKKSLDY